MSQGEKDMYFEQLACDHSGYLHCEGKMMIAMVTKLTGASKRRWTLKLQQRRNEGLTPPQGRQLLFWILLQWMQTADQDGECLQALLALRDNCEKEAVTATSLSSFKDLFDLALLKGSNDHREAAADVLAGLPS